MAEMDEDSEPLELYPCGVCGRTFLSETLHKHERICEKTSKKQRRPFNSLAQRVSGTDLALFHMKSYLKPNSKQQHASGTDGATSERLSRERSPVKNRSQPKHVQQHVEHHHKEVVEETKDVKAVCSSTSHLEPVVPKRSTSSIRSTATPAGEKCPHCDRAFGHRAFERHVEWCKEHQSRVQTSPASVKIAKERLEARTKYRAPAVRNQRQLVREKYSSQKRSPSQQRRDSSADEDDMLTPTRPLLARTGSLRQPTRNDRERKTSPPIRRSASMRRESSGVGRTPSVKKPTKPTGYLSRQSSQNEDNTRKSKKKEEISPIRTPMKPMKAHMENVVSNTSSPIISDSAYDPFVLAERQLQELLSDKQIPFVVTKTPLQHTPRPSTAPCQPSIIENSISKRASGSNLTLPSIHEPKSAFVPIVKGSSLESKSDSSGGRVLRRNSTKSISRQTSASSSTRSNRKDSQSSDKQFSFDDTDKSPETDTFRSESNSTIGPNNFDLIPIDTELSNSVKVETNNNNNNNNESKIYTRASIIDPPNDFQDEMKLFQDNFEYLENLVNANYNAEIAENSSGNTFDVYCAFNKSNHNLGKIQNDSYSDSEQLEKSDTIKIIETLPEKKPGRKTSEKAKYNIDSKSMLSLNSILGDNFRNDDLYDNQIDPSLINSVDNLSIPDDLRADDATDHYSLQYDKQIATLEPLVLTKTEMNSKRTNYEDSDSVNDDFDIDGFIAVLDDDEDAFPTVKTFLKHQHSSDNDQSLRQSSVSLNSSILGNARKSPETVKGSSSMAYLKKSVSSLFDPVTKPRNLKNKDDVEKYFGEKSVKKKQEDKGSIQQELFSVDDEIYEEYKKYEQLYLQEKMLAEANQKSNRDSLKVNRQALYAGDDNSSPEDLSSPERQNESREHLKPSGDSAYSSLNRSSPKPYTRSSQHKQQRSQAIGNRLSERDRCPSSSGSDISLPPVPLAYRKSNAIHRSMINSITPRHFDFEPIATSDNKGDSIELPTEADEKIPGSRKSSIDSTASGRLSKFCYECGSAFPVSNAKFCVNCGVARLVL